MRHMQVREIFESAVEMEPPHELPDADCRTMCMRYAELERKLGEVRFIYLFTCVAFQNDRLAQACIGYQVCWDIDLYSRVCAVW